MTGVECCMLMPLFKTLSIRQLMPKGTVKSEKLHNQHIFEWKSKTEKDSWEGAYGQRRWGFATWKMAGSL